MVLVTNISPETSESDLWSFFSHCGPKAVKAIDMSRSGPLPTLHLLSHPLPTLLEHRGQRGVAGGVADRCAFR